MTTFDNREQGYENRYIRGESLAFDVRMRAYHLFGLWAADMLGFSKTMAEDYAETLIETGLDPATDKAVLEQVGGDLSIKSISVSQHRLARRLAQYKEQARKEIMEMGETPH